MKHIFRRLGCLLLAMLLVVGLIPLTAFAWSFNAGTTVHFQTDWTNPCVQLMIGHSTWSEGYKMAKVTGAIAPANHAIYSISTIQWDNATECAVFGTDGIWGGEGKNITHRKGWAPNSTNVITLTKNLDSSKEYVIKGSTIEEVLTVFSFDANGGSGTMMSVGHKALEYTLPACTFTAPEGKVFAGWSLSADGAVITTSTIKTLENTTLYAQWKDGPEAMWGTSKDNLTAGGSFIDAINAANTSADVAYIQLQKDVTYSESQTLEAKNENLTIDWNGNDFTASTSLKLKSKLTLKDTATTPGTAKITANGYSLVNLWSGANLQILSGNYEVDCMTGDLVYVNSASASATISGGSFSGGHRPISNSTGTLIISGGDFFDGNWGLIHAGNGSKKTTISGGTFTGTPTIEYYGGKLEFSGDFPEGITIEGNNSTAVSVADKVTMPADYSLLLQGTPSATIENGKTYTVAKTPYKITVENNLTGGSVSADKTSASAGQTVTVTATPAADYEVESITYRPDGQSIVMGTPVDNQYSFQMPSANVTVSATFKRHTHTWSFTGLQTDKVTASCGCGAKETLQIHAPDLQNGSYNATLSDGNGGQAPATLGGLTVGNIRYGTATDKLLQAPTTSGEYIASVTIGDESFAKVEYKIEKKQPVIPTGLVAYYSNTLADITLPTGWRWTWDNPSTPVGDVGTKTFKASFDGDANTEAVTAVDLTVEVKPSAVEVTVTTDKTEYTYGDIVKITVVRTPTGKPATEPVSVDDSLKNVVLVGDPSEANPYVDMANLPYYAPGGITVEVDTAKWKVAPGALNWRIVVAPDGNVEMGGKDFDIKLNKAELEVTAPTATEITYGQTLADSTLNGGAASGVDGDPVAVHFAWKDASVAPEVADSLTTEYDVTVTPQDGTYYKSAEVKVKVKVNKAQQEAPVLTPVNETVETKADGKIIGLTTAMEITTKANAADSEYTKVTDPDMTFAPGTYYVRYYETDNYLPSAATTVEIGEGLNVGITWVIDGEEDYEDLAPGDAVTAPADPTKEGHTFLGWEGDEIPATMPAENITITLTSTWEKNSYKLTWVIDGETTEKTIPYGDTIEAPADPTMEGNTFLGWEGDEIPATMPGVDTTITLTSTWEKNTYKLTWVIDGVEKEETLKYGDAITAPADPTKEGHKFLGWEGDEIPATMPAEGITITLKSTWEKNSYKLTWVIDGVEKEETLKYGDAITAPANPTKEGYKFLGWEGDKIPETMPAEDTTITLKSTWEKLQSSDPNVPDTSDPSQMVLWTILSITSILGMAVMVMMFPWKKGKYEVE